MPRRVLPDYTHPEVQGYRIDGCRLGPADGTMQATMSEQQGTAMEISGFAEPRFAAVSEAFEQNFASHDEVGAACTVYLGGRPVVDIWGGIADPRSGGRWEENTLQLVFSAAKGPTATCIHRLVEQGRLDIDAPIARYWPEFAAGGKQALSPALTWRPTVRLHRSLNNDPEQPGSTVTGAPREVTAENGVRFLAWDFNDIDVSLARDPLNQIFLWVSLDDTLTYTNIWVHGAEPRTIFPQVDLLNACR